MKEHQVKTISPDADIENADWTKQAWDMPPYKSPEFMRLYPNLDAFRKLPVYAAAVAAFLIHDDEWVDDFTSDADDQPSDD